MSGGFEWPEPELERQEPLDEPTRDFPRSGTACFSCPGVSQLACCQHSTVRLRYSFPSPPIDVPPGLLRRLAESPRRRRRP